MSPRRALIAFALLSALCLVGLLVAGAQGTNTDAFSNTEPLLEYAAKLDPGQNGCQGPIAAPADFRRVMVFLDNAGPASVRLTVRDAGSGRVLAAGARSIDVKQRPQEVHLNATVTARAGVTLCLANLGPKPVAVLGGPKTNVSGVFRLGGRTSPTAAAFLFQHGSARSQLSLLPTALRRAALFKPSWVGTWTFWVLLVAVLGMFVVLGAALGSAFRAEPASAELQAEGSGVQREP